MSTYIDFKTPKFVQLATQGLPYEWFYDICEKIHNDEENARILNQTNNVRLNKLSCDRHILCGTNNVCWWQAKVIACAPPV